MENEREEMEKALDAVGKKLFSKGEAKAIGRRPASWPPLNMEEVRRKVGVNRVSCYDRVLVNIHCRTEDEAADLIRRRIRIDAEDESLSRDILSQYAREEAARKYLPTRYTDLEDDNYYRQEVRTLNG